MIKYSITMGIRTVCVVLCIFARGWWLLVCAVGAVVLPYFAVVLANVSWSSPSVVERPGSLVPVKREQPPAQEPRRPLRLPTFSSASTSFCDRRNGRDQNG